MPQRIERQAPGTLGGIVPQPIGDQAVAEFMEGDADQRGDYRLQNAQQIAEVESIPDVLQNADTLTPKILLF